MSYVEKLVAICKYYGFDGYLINIETKVKSPEKLIAFMKFLQMRLKEEIPDSLVIYYDSHNAKGDLKFQSCLNEENFKYFEGCDYFFTDYHWDV
jgi:mannosyl-glycoprotein endo-beta-N-acetylglucosaminidase